MSSITDEQIKQELISYLEVALRVLEWYQDTYPESVDSADYDFKDSVSELLRKAKL